MTVPLTGPEGLFTRIGRMFGLTNKVNAVRGADVPPFYDLIASAYQDTDVDLISGLYANLTTYQNAANATPSYLRSLATNTITRMVNDDLAQTSLQSLSVCMQTLIDQMIAASATVQSCLCSASHTLGPSNAGNAQFAISTYRSDGLVNENMIDELIIANVTRDAQSGGAIEGQETWQLQGQYAIGDPLSYLFPVGSGSNSSLTCVSGSQSNGRGAQNNLVNSDFEDWTVANTPDSWNIGVGTAGSTIFRSSAEHYDGANSLRFLGDGSQLTEIYQWFSVPSSAGNSSTVIAPIQQYAFNVWIKVSSVPLAGVLQFALCDSTGAITVDEQGQQNTLDVDLTLASTSWTAHSAFFRTPRVLVDPYRIRVKLTTALSGTVNLFIDRMALAVPTSLYAGGPAVAIFSGNVPLITGDSGEITISNDYGGDMQRMFDRFFGMRSLGMILPSSGTPSLPDSLINYP